MVLSILKDLSFHCCFFVVVVENSVTIFAEFQSRIHYQDKMDNRFNSFIVNVNGMWLNTFSPRSMESCFVFETQNRQSTMHTQQQLGTAADKSGGHTHTYTHTHTHTHIHTHIHTHTTVTLTHTHTHTY